MKRVGEEIFKQSVENRLRDNAVEDVTDGAPDATFDAVMQKRAVDVFDKGTDGTGYLNAKVVMRWPPSNGKLQVLLSAMDEGPRKQFTVVFTGECYKYRELLNLRPNDELQLALKAAVVQKPTRIMYEEGVLLKFVKIKDLKHAGQIVDTWNRELCLIPQHYIGTHSFHIQLFFSHSGHPSSV